jgi:hypothetical protein
MTEDQWIQELAYEGRCMETIMRETGRSQSYIEKVLLRTSFALSALPKYKEEE